jgi:hypothetical protein
MKNKRPGDCSDVWTDYVHVSRYCVSCDGVTLTHEEEHLVIEEHDTRWQACHFLSCS